MSPRAHAQQLERIRRVASSDENRRGRSGSTVFDKRNAAPAFAVSKFAAGLTYYGADTKDIHQRLAEYIDLILKGAKPADLPVGTPTKFELIINLKVAKALGLSIPATILVRADEVIE